MSGGLPDGTITLASDTVEYATALQQLKEKFNTMMQRLHLAFSTGGSTTESIPLSILSGAEAQDFIATHAGILDSSFEQTPMSDALRTSLQRSDYIFSGIKTFHELNEAFPSLVDANGKRKPFEQFLNDVRSIDDTYNKNYLRAEYNFCQQSANMASKWEQFQQDGDRYNLQYRTAGDDHVRPAHAALDRITLPPSHPFWQKYFPPNGWNCRCTVVQVRKSKYPQTPDSEVEHLILQNDTDNPKEAMFRFNPGSDRSTVPAYNAYTIRQCTTCPVAQQATVSGTSASETATLAFVPQNELCQACQLIRRCEKMGGYAVDGKYGERLLISRSTDLSELADNKRAAYAILDSFKDIKMCIRNHIIEPNHKNPEYLINGLLSDRKGVHSPKGISDGFKKAIKQGCKSVVIDLDMHLGQRLLSVGQVSKYIDWRRADFEDGIIEECYVVYGGKAVVINKTHSTKEAIMAELEKLKQ